MHYFIVYCIGYGMTESSPMILYPPVNNWKTGSAGILGPNTVAKVKCLSRYYRILDRFVPSTMDELPSHSQPVNPSHVTLNGLSHYYPIIHQ